MIEASLFPSNPLKHNQRLGLVYMGSKRRIIAELMVEMFNRVPNATHFIDVFGGGGAASFYASQCGLKVHYNDKMRHLYELFNFIKTHQSPPKRLYEFISFDDWKVGIQSTDFNDGMTLCAPLLTFGGFSLRSGSALQAVRDDEATARAIFAYVLKGEGGLKWLQGFYPNILKDSDLSKMEQRMSKAVGLKARMDLLRTWNHDLQYIVYKRIESEITDFLAYKRKEAKEHYKGYGVIIENYMRQLYALRHTSNKLMINYLQNMTLSNCDYRDVPLPRDIPRENVIIYLDPPYQGTAEYEEAVDYDMFYNWVDELIADGFYVFISEYSTRLPVIWSRSINCSLSSQTNSLVRHEVLGHRPPPQDTRNHKITGEIPYVDWKKPVKNKDNSNELSLF